LTKDGQERTNVWRSTAVSDRSGDVTWVIATGIDATERLQQQAELQRVNALANYGPLPVLLLDRKGIVQSTNTAALQAFNKRRLAGENWRRLCPGLNEQQFDKLLRSASAEAMSHEVKLGPRSYVFDLFGIPDRRVVQVYGREVTEIRESQERQKESEAVLAAFVEGAQDAILIMDSKANITECNPQAERLSGYRRNELVGKNAGRLRLFSGRQLATLVRGGGRNPGAENFELQRKDGRRVGVTVSRSPVRRGGRQEAMVVMRDTTERRKAAEDLARCGAQLDALRRETEELRARTGGSAPLAEQAVRLLDRVRAEQRLPLGQLRNAVNAVKLALAGCAAQGARSTGDNLGQALDDLERTWGETRARLDPGPAERRWVDPESLLTTALNRVGQSGPVRVERLPAVTGVEINADPAQIGQALGALIDNALEAMPAGGTLTCGCELLEKELLILIRDSGTGMTPEQQAGVFQPFFSSRPEGMGLGLFVARARIQASGGRIEFKSGPGAGTEFRVSFPARTAGSVPREPAAPGVGVEIERSQ
jgi:PAS domain S-box-containing protein